MPSWDAEREAALVDAVRRFGRHPQCWQAFARLPDLIVFTAQALRQRWSQLCQQHPPEQVYTHCSQDRVPPLGEPPAFREAAELTLVDIEIPVHQRRPWQYHVQKTHSQGLVRSQGTLKQRRLAVLWQLDVCLDGRTLLLCNLPRAIETLVRRWTPRYGSRRARRMAYLRPLTPVERDALGLVVYPGGTCHTLTTGCRFTWVGGPDAGAGGLVTAAELAGFMCLHASGGAYDCAKTLMTPPRMCACLAESVHGLAARQLALSGKALLSPHTPCTSICSLYSGAFDSLTTGARHAFPDLYLKCCVESADEKAAVLRASSAPEVLVRLAEDPVFHAVGHVSVLVASPPCVDVSAMRRALPGESREVRALSAVRAQCSALLAAILALRPFLCLLEQSIGLRTHYRSAYRAWSGWLHSTPYYVTMAIHDPASTNGASHRRTRLLYALVRLDCLSAPMPDTGMGAPHLACPLFGVCACGYPLLWSGACCRQRCASAQSSS